MTDEETLNREEWIVTLSLIILITLVTLITHKHWFTCSSERYSSPHYAYEQKIKVQVTGAVDCPGFYTVDKGANMEAVLALAKPSLNADLKKITLAKKVREGQLIHIPTMEYINIQLEGAVECPGVVQVPKGTLMEELIGLIQFKEQADLSKLKKRKKLKDGEYVKVSYTKKPSLSSSKHEFYPAD